jgi:Ca2+-binding RTX toxin-like protein
VATGAGNDQVTASYTVVRSGSLTVDLGDGDDSMELGNNRAPTSISILEEVLPGNDFGLDGPTGTAGRMELDAGAGRDEIVVQRRTGLRSIDLDLTADTLRTRKTLVATLVGFEDVYASSSGTVQIAGDRGDNTIAWAACGAGAVNAGGGDDSVQRHKRRNCRNAADPVFRTLGGPGRDHLWGTAGRDLLIGGSGRDHGDGSSGHDVCRSIEVARSC